MLLLLLLLHSCTVLEFHGARAKQFEELLALGANDTTVLDKGFDGRNFSLPLVLQAPALSSRLFAAMPEHIRDIVTKQNVTYNNHAAGITPEHMASLHPHTHSGGSA